VAYRRLVAFVSAALLTLVLAACGGGGSGGEISPSDPPVSTASGADTFLLFPNPQKQPDGSLQTNYTAYAQAYYAAIDPTDAKDTLAKWKAANGFDTGTGTQVTAVFGDSRDLGYGRRMTARVNPDGTIAFLVENYLVNPGRGYGFSTLSLDAAVVQDTRWRALVNAIEFSPGPGGSVSFAKFFNFDPSTGQRQLSVDLDGRGAKAMPGPCITCHGGRGDALTPPDATGRQLLSLVQSSATRLNGETQRGDVQAHLAPLEVGTFEFSTRGGFTRPEQEAALKAMNAMVLCTYPYPSASSLPRGVYADTCRRERRAAVPSEWQGTAAALILNAYGGDRLPSGTYSDTYVPADWSANNQAALYRNVVVPSCRACHILRGTAPRGTQPEQPDDIDFNSYAGFRRYADRIKAHVIDRGDMPLAKIVYDAFWSPTSPGPSALADFLQQANIPVRDAAGAVLQPGRPIADPGPDRTTRQESALSAAASLFATSYSWSIVSTPAGADARLTNPDSARPTFRTTVNGPHVLQLVAINGAARSAPARVTLFVDDGLSPPELIRFSNVRTVLESTVCTSCHSPAPGSSLAQPPVFFTDDQGNPRTDDSVFCGEILSRINFADIVASPLLRKPSGHHHGGGGPLTGFDTTLTPGATDRAGYDLFLNWSLNNAATVTASSCR
jgi:mono/diheme cytochrome c family protein